MSTRREFLLSYDCEVTAWSVGFRLGAHLVGYGLAERYGIAVRRLPLRRADGPAWALWLVDRTPGEPAPSVLLASAPLTTRALVVELLALAA
ncbi:hypothetical protein ACIQWA_39705 [Kitasatospora sp. NPDC098652]|uniref:hypothetical protein n=1 Tax=Kitasatospora sp. NPDC098652 TaxID=3364095 RepID=UPI00382C2934